MADRSAAALFAMVFGHLAANPTKENKAFALELWDRTGDYDFDSYQMYCDDELVKLDLAAPGIWDGEDAMFYGPEGNRRP